jgi:hypothetical protein
LVLTSTAAAVALVISTAQASSHREAPLITYTPKVDNTDLYLFNSYESGREGFVTIIANYQPFEQPYAGPNYYPFDKDALYEIHIDNNGDAVEDMTFSFKFNNEFKNIALDIGGESVPIPLINSGPIGPTATDTDALNRIETYEIDVVRGHDGGAQSQPATVANPESGTSQYDFVKPVDNIGEKTIADYEAYASDHIYDVVVPGCNAGARVFVGQRKEGFVVNVGEAFDLINFNPLGDPDSEPNGLQNDNVSTIALEVPANCLTNGSDPVIGAWATARKPTTDAGVAYFRQVSRLAMPLVNELVIGLPDKDRFNASKPKDDAQFLKYVTNPTFPAIVELLFPDAKAPTAFPRQDLVNVYLMGIEGLNRPANVVPAEMTRLNTSIPAVPASEQKPLGVLDGDNAGFPNGRRPGDDVVDVTLRVAMGALLPEEDAPAGQMPFTDGSYIDATQFDEAFPYLLPPIPGSPNEAIFGDDTAGGSGNGGSGGNSGNGGSTAD